MSTETNKCEWISDDYEDGWSTSCGLIFIINDGTPEENHMKFCCYCGKEIEQRIEGDPYDDQD